MTTSTARVTPALPSKDLARAIWAVVLVARDEYKARGLLGKATRKQLVEAIVALMKLVRKAENE